MNGDEPVRIFFFIVSSSSFIITILMKVSYGTFSLWALYMFESNPNEKLEKVLVLFSPETERYDCCNQMIMARNSFPWNLLFSCF